MLFEDTYRTIEAPCEGLFKDRGSKFYAFAFPIRRDEEAKERLISLRELHPKAVHHCYAYRLGLDRTQYRLSDDGEPSGTAGRPILNTLYAQEITNALVVVVRYFGGTLLGVPGLINAYKQATLAALAEATVVERQLCDAYELRFAYVQMNDVMRIVKQQSLPVLHQSFELTCMLTILIRKSKLNEVLGAFDTVEGLEAAYQYSV